MDLTGPRILKDHVAARLLVVALFRELRPELKPTQIGNVIRRDRCSIRHSLKLLDQKFASDPEFADRFVVARDALRARIDVEPYVAPPKVDRRRKAVKVLEPPPERFLSEWQEDIATRQRLKHSELRLLLALRDAHPELECSAFQSQGQ